MHWDTYVYEMSICTPSFEIMWVCLKLKQTRPQYLALVYRPPGGDLDEATRILDDQIAMIRASGNCDYMVIGDINVDTMKPCDNRTRKLKDFYRIAGLNNLVRGVTCHSNNHESSIDHICVNRVEMFEHHGIIHMNASVHNLTFAARKQPKLLRSQKYIWGRSFCRFDSILFERDIVFMDWSDVTEELDANLA